MPISAPLAPLYGSPFIDVGDRPTLSGRPNPLLMQRWKAATLL